VRRDSESSRMGGVLLYIEKNIKEIVTIEICERNSWSIMIKISNRNRKEYYF